MNIGHSRLHKRNGRTTQPRANARLSYENYGSTASTLEVGDSPPALLTPPILNLADASQITQDDYHDCLSMNLKSLLVRK